MLDAPERLIRAAQARAHDPQQERAALARSLAWLYGAGATLVLITLLVPHSRSTNDAAVAAPALLAYVVVGVLLWWPSRLPTPAYPLLPALGAALVSICVGFGGGGADAYAFMYVWVTLISGYFFSRRVVAAQALVCAAGYALALGLGNANQVPGIYWLMAIGTATVAAAVIGVLTRRIRGQAADLAALSQLAKAVSDLDSFRQATCARLRQSSGADVVVLFEPGPDGPTTAAIAGSTELATVFEEPAASKGVARALRVGEPVALPAEGRDSLRPGSCRGLAQPVLHDGAPVGAYALAWERPRVAVGDRVAGAARLFAAETGVAMERAAEQAREHVRRAMEINDNIIQGLVVAKYAVDAGQVDQGQRAIEETLERAREIANDQLRGVAEGVGGVPAGTLVREQPGTLEGR